MVTNMINQKPEELWKEWKKSRSQDKLTALIQMFEPDINYIIMTYRAADVPDFAIEAEAKKNLIKGFESYDPKFSTSLRTHVVNYMKKTRRFVVDNQNVGKIPEARSLQITKFKDVHDRLHNRFGRPASSMEMADELRWDIAEVSRMRKELRGGVIGEGADLSKSSYNFVNDAMSTYIYNSISPKFRPLFEYTVGYAGAKELSASEIKKKLRLSDAEYRKLRSDLNKELIKYHAYELAEKTR
jgi:hypothetical protein